MTQFSLSTQTISGFDGEKIGDISPIRLNSGEVILCVRQGRQLLGYKYVPSTATWRREWSELVFDQPGNYPLDRYPWLVTDKIFPDKHIILLRHPNGIQFYQLDPAKPGLKLLKEDIKFNEFFSGDLLWGHFYPDTKYVGVMTRDVNRRIKFYASTLQPNKPPLSPLKVNVPFQTWSSPENKFFATRLRHNDSEVIGLRTGQGLEFYQFNSDYLLEQVTNTSIIARVQDQLFFADLTHQIYQDILHLNDSGLFVYQYNDNQRDYRFLHRHNEFTQPYGWSPHYANSIQLTDLNSDGRDDLLFTGPRGITALSFDVTNNSWKTLLGPEQLIGAQRYANVVCALPSMTPAIVYSSVLTQDAEGKVQWGLVKPTPVIPFSTTTVPSTSTTLTTSVNTAHSPSIRGNDLFPEQIPRQVLPEKPALRWAEQWNDGFLKETVDPASGHAHLNIPLVDIFATTGWKLQLSLSYNSRVTTSDVSGIGWSLPMAQDYIFVDHQGSIFPEDAHYYLMTGSRPQRLRFLSDEKGIRHFQLQQEAEGTQITISYHQSEQRWIIESETEQTIYGKAKHSVVQDALQWSLGWPNWRSIGRDKAHQQPLLIAWYLNMRLDKDSKRMLYYHYEKDKATIAGGKTYDSALRLKGISDDQYLRLNLDYALREKSEYTSHNPVDDEGNIIFPVSLVQSHYLQGYSLTTSSYSQTLSFVYQIKDGKRLLTDIKQRLLSHTEPVLHFTYQTILDKQVLQSCALVSKGSTVHFNYQSLAPPSLTSVRSYPTREKARITYGSDYALMTYRDLDPRAGKVLLRIMNRAMTQIIVDCAISTKLSCPVSESEIKDYAVKVYQNSFIIFIESNQKQSLYIYNRHEQTWSTNPTKFEFSKEALVQYSESIIAVADSTKNNIMLFKRAENHLDWSEHSITVSRDITVLALHKKLIVGYDDHQLWLFYFDSQTGWKKKLLENLPYSARQILDLFELDSDIRQQIVTVITQRSLQIHNNFILFNTFQENHGRLSSHTHLFLLDSQYDIIKKQTYKIERDNVNELSDKLEFDGSGYEIVYVKEQGRFKAQIKSISGKIIENIITNNKVRNKNIIENIRNGDDSRVKETIKHLNQNWKENLNKRFFINLSLYIAQISNQGVYIGNDTLLRITGTGWEKESTPTQLTGILGKHFVLESDNDDKSLFKLYRQGSDQKKQGQPLETLQLYAPDQIINQYPDYIAYHPEPNLVKVLTFKDEQTLGRFYIFDNEQLLSGSDYQNLLTVANSTTSTHAEPQECRVRAVSALLPSKMESFVNRVTLSASDIERITAYERSFNADQRALIYNETVAIIPGNNKVAYGWQEATRSYHRGNVTNTDRCFNADGTEVLMPPEEKSVEQAANETEPVSNPMLLLDRSGKRLISDFSPYDLAEEMVAYYGFEPYENNQIGIPAANSATNSWRINRARIVKGNFAFVGEHYLELKSTFKNQPSFLEGLFQPRDQETTYLAACWIRCSAALTLDTTVPYLRAIIRTITGQKIIALSAQTKRQIGDWFYLELPLNFQVLRQIYRDYVNYNAITESNSVQPSQEEANLQIVLRVEAPDNQTIDLDHIRFSPITHDFQAAVYNPITDKPTAVIKANGLVTRTIYNRLDQEIASIDEDGNLQEFSSSSRTGKLVPSPRGNIIDSKPNVITLEPENGSYETFDRNSWRTRWKLDNPAVWNVAPGQLWHKQSGKHIIQAATNLFDHKSAAIRCYFALQESGSALSLNWKEIGRLKFTRKSNGFTDLTIPNAQSLIAPLPSAGELIVMLEENYLWIWLDAVLIVDQALPITSSTPWSMFGIEADGKVLVEDLLVMNRPQTTINYYNAFGDKTQEIQLEDATTAQVSEILYDALGRKSITTKTTRVHRNAGQSLLAYRSDFVSNKNTYNQQSVWQTGILQGEVNRLNPSDQGVAYTRTGYAPNPLDQEQNLGLPGPDFSITGRYSTKVSQHSDLAFLDNLFPSNNGYRQRVEHTSNGSLRIFVFDQANNQVAKYVRVPSFDHLLSTYEYDTEKRLIKILPPLYHEKAETDIRLTAWKFGEDHLSPAEKQLQYALASRFVYDKYGHLIRKITPDSGTTEYLYNAAGQKRFMVSLGATNESQKIVYFNYDSNDQLISTGHINRPLSLTALRQHLESTHLPYAIDYQTFDYSDGHFDPLLRGRVKEFITLDEGEVIIEKLHFDALQQVMSKNAILNEATSDSLNNIEKQYAQDKLQKIIYPVAFDGKPLHVVHSYNRLGQLTGLGTPNNPTRYARFTYHATGQLASEQYQQGTSLSFTRNYHYNSPGFLEKISDPFLTEDIAYANKGYGQAGYGDGMIMQATFNANWPVNADGRWFQIHENDLGGNYSAVCVKALKRTGHLSDNGQPMKLYIRDAETALPLVCGGEMGRRMARLVAEKQKPTYYGHRYAYGNHQELTKAKYLIDDVENLTDPLQPDSFAKKIPGLNKQQSQHIWQLLTDADYIITDQQRDDPATAIGRRGESFFRNADLKADLRALNDKYVVYVEPIKRLIISAISRQKTLSLVDFSATFLHWQNLNLASSRLIYNWQQGIANQIGQMLLDKGYLPTQISDFTRCLNSHFITTLHQYTVFIPKIVQTLSHHFSYELGQTAFDVESTKIDANGNHHLFYTGFDRYELAYRDVTNQIDRIELDWPIESRVKQILSMKHDDQGNAHWLAAFSLKQPFAMEHDEQGNVIQALHKNIQHIEYHPVSSRTTRIKLTDGRTLRFYYDAQGERVVKRVLNAEGLISQETHYLRDEQGRVLIDRQTKYLDGSTQYVITAYLYGPRGLIGFIRNNNFYNVTTDHSGSVRLVIKDGRVVAAYDYLPYGGLMRSYGNDPQAHISYRYTGQEWDEETGLYNYHARLYDPSIGRFYQPDPKAQYFSPYKYAGNSPISEVDPDGELAFLLISLALGVLGAYLGGAAANDRWNPVEWDFTDPGTYLGIGGGAIAGALLPVGFAASAAAIGGLAGSAAIGVTATVGLGVGGAYLTTAASTGSWDPSKWKWDRPNTWSSLFQGFGAGSGIAGGIGITHNFANSGKVIVYLGNLKALNAIGIGQRAVKGVFLTVSYASAGGLAYYRAGSANDGNFAFWEWDWTNPATWSGLVDGFDTGMGWPQNVMEMSRGVGRLAKNPKKYLFSGQNQLKLKSILKDSKHPLYKATTGVVMAYFMGSSANGDFDITKWNLASFSTYEGVLNGVFFGKDITKSLKYIRDVKVKQPSNAGIHSLRKKINNNWSRTVSRILDFIQMSRLGQKYQNLAENIFTSKTLWISKLNDQPLSIKNQFEKFIQGGFQKWKSGENRPPLELQKLILGETKLTVQEGSELIKWKSEGEETIRKQQEVFPDEEDALFLNCKGSRRRKRGTVPCFIPMEDMKQEHNPELISEFFKSFDEGIARGVDLGDEYKLIQPNTSEDPRYPNGFDPSNPQGFAENLTLLLNKTPNILAPTHEDFFTNLILGSILTMPDMQKTSGKVIYANIETVNLPDSNGHQLFSHKFLKTGFKEGNTLVLKTFIAEDRNLTFGREKGEKGRIHEHVKKWLDGVSKYSEIELNLLNQKFDRGSIYTHIQENVYYIHTDNSLSMRSSSTGKSEYFQNYSNQMKVILQDLIDVIATQKPIRGADRKNSLVQYLENIDIYNTDKVKALQDKIKKIEKVNALTDSELQTIANAAMNSKVETILDKNIIKLAEIALQDTSPRGSPSVKKPKVEITTDDDVISVADTITHETTLSEISSLDINKVEQGIVEFSTDVLKLYYDHKSTFGFDLNSESGFHGFFYGALALNFKNRYNLDVYVERISGRGYADMLLLSRNGPDGNKNWHAIPIIFEFKADSTSAGKATDQVTGTGYLYNLSMRTVAEKAIVIGINSKLDSEIDIYSAITTRKEDIPRIEGFMQELKKITKGVGSANNFETELKHLYYSTSPLAIKGDDHYMSNLILGEILSEKDRKILVQNNGDFRTFVFQEGDKWVMLNVIESSEKRKDKFKFKDIKIEDKIKLPSEISDTSNIIRFDISVNPKSKDGWSSLEPKRSVGKITNASDYYFQGIKQKDVNSNLGKAEYQKINSVDMTNFIGAPDDILKSLSKSLGSIKDIINSESDFQAVLQGLFMGHAVNTADQGIIMKVFPEANLSKEGRSDLIISVLKKEPNGQIHEEGIFVMELKYAKGDDDDAKLGEGNRQVKKYGSNLASVTDLGVYTPIVAVCCQPGIKFKVHDVETIHHPSPRSQPVSIDDILNFPPPPAVGGASSSFLGDTRKRPKPSDRRKRSLGYVRNAKVSAASSGSSKLQFRPFNMIINVLTTVLSFLSINWLSSSKENEDQHLPPSDFLPRSQSSIDQRSLGKTLLESHSEQQSPSNNFPTGPTLLEMGDQWINRTDVNGLLTWGTLLARKWTGYRPKAVTASSYDPSIAIKLNIQAHELVDAFIGDLAIHAQTCGVGKAVSDLLENTDLYTNILETTRRKLAKGQLDGVSDFLFQHVVQQNIRKLATMSTQVQANELLMKVKKALPDLQQQFIQQNSELQNHCEEGQLPYATPKDNTNFVRQETSSMESVNQFSHPDSLVKETQSRTCNIVPNYTDHFKQLC